MKFKLSERILPAYEAHQDGDDCDNQQEMNKSPERIRGYQS